LLEGIFISKTSLCWTCIITGLLLCSASTSVESENPDNLQSETSAQSSKSSLNFIDWQKCLIGIGQPVGKTSDEYIQEIKDDGYIVAGTSSDNECDVASIKKTEFGVLKLNLNGNQIWKKCLGGDHEDMAYSIHQTVDGGYVVVGGTRFEPGDNRGCHGPLENSNGWVVKLDRQGNMMWQSCLGGSRDDSFCSIEQTSDGGYIVAGDTLSEDGDVNGLHEDSSGYLPKSDCWVVKLDSQGNMMWQKCLGGSSSEGANSIQETKDGNYILAGYTGSKDGDVNGWHEGYNGNSPYYDCWVVKLDRQGNMLWQKCLGGSSSEGANSIQETKDGNYILAGYTGSKDGDVNGWHEGSYGYTPSSDCWVVKLDRQGNMLWQKCLGGSSSEGANSIQETKDGNYILAGYASSKDGDVNGWHESYIGNLPYYDCWVVKLSSANGAMQWQKCLGGNERDEAYSVVQTNDEGYIMIGMSLSNDGDLSGNMCPGQNFWMVKLRNDNYFCFSNLPKPNLAYLDKRDYTVRGNKFTRYLLDVTNKDDYPASLFKAAPDLLPCGKNNNAARTWVNIYDEKETYIYGFCALSSPTDLGKIWFAVPKGSTPPDKVYVMLIDRRCDPPSSLKSNMVAIK